MRPVTVAALLLAATLAVPAAGQDAGAPVPDWHRDFIDFLSRESGRWVGDNTPYRSDIEAATEYVLEFAPSLDGTSMTGRMYGQVDGRYLVTMWEYRGYWDPATGTSVMLQVGWDGQSGIGAVVPEGEGAFRYRQTVSTPGLPARVEEQLITVIDENTYRMEAWGLDADGERVPTRTYTYLRDPVF